MAEDLKISRVGLVRIATVVLGVYVLGIGLYSHFHSAWIIEVEIPGSHDGRPGRPLHPGGPPTKWYEHCLALRDDLKTIEGPCPNIFLEHYYVSIITICFILSVIGLIASFMTELTSRPMKYVDFGYHAVAAFLLLSAAITYIISAVQIHNVPPPSESDSALKQWDRSNLYGEKLVAGVLTIVQALVYGVTAVLIAKQSGNNGGNNGANQWGYQQGGNVLLAQPSLRTAGGNNGDYPDNNGGNNGANPGGYQQGGNVQLAQPVYSHTAKPN